MFRNRSHARGQQRAGHPCFRPQLECLEARTLLDASGSVTAALATLANDLGQAVNDAVHLQGAAVKQDASKISQDVSNVKTQIRNIPGVNLALDISAVANGIQAVAAGLYVREAGVAVSDTGAGAAVGIPVVALFGPSDARVWAPRGDRVTIIVARQLDVITAGEAARAVDVLL